MNKIIGYKSRLILLNKIEAHIRITQSSQHTKSGTFARLTKPTHKADTQSRHTKPTHKANLAKEPALFLRFFGHTLLRWIQ